MIEAEGEVGYPENRFKTPSILILTVPRRYFCCGSLLLLVLAVRIYTLVQLFISDIFCKFWVAEWPPVWERAVHSVYHECLS